MPRPPANVARTVKSTLRLPGERKASPGGESFGLCFAESPYRPSSVTPLACHLPPGEGFSLSRRAFASNLPLRHCNQAGGGCRRPYSASPVGPPEIRARRNTKAAGTTCGFRMKEIRGEEKMKKKKQLKFCSASLLCSFIIPGKCEERKW